MADQAAIRRAILWAVAIWMAHLVAMFLATIVTVAIVEPCLGVLEDSEVDLAASAVLAINLSDYCRHYWYTLLVPAALDAGLLMALGFAPPRLNWLVWLWSTLWFLGAILFMAFTTTAIVRPTLSAIQTLRN